MANKKVTELDAITSASTDDILPIVDAPGGSAATKKITFDNLQKSITTIDTTKTGVLKASSGVIAVATAGTDYLAPGAYVDRGDPAAYDFEQGAMTTDNTWRDMDLSSIVPAGAKAVLLSVWARQTTDTERQYSFRKNGNSNAYAMSTNFNQVTSKLQGNDFVVSLDANRVIEYRFETGVTWSLIRITVKGWWL